MDEAVSLPIWFRDFRVKFGMIWHHGSPYRNDPWRRLILCRQRNPSFFPHISSYRLIAKKLLLVGKGHVNPGLKLLKKSFLFMLQSMVVG